MKDKYKLITKKTYDFFAKNYADRDKKIIAETIEVKKALNRFVKLLLKRARILDIGSGTGRDSRFLFEKGFRVIGIDFSKKMIEEARKINPLPDNQ